MARLLATVIVSRTKGRAEVDSEVRVKSLDDLYAACRDAPPSTVARVSIKGPAGEVRLNFASFIKPGTKE